jgi:hypothetical protein
MTTQTDTETKAQRRQRQLDAHYSKCEALARKLGATNPNGKKISNALLKLERQAHNAATAQCNGETYNGEPYRDDDHWAEFTTCMRIAVSGIFGARSIPGLFVNADARGYALKIDNDNEQGKSLIDELRLHTDWGGYGILSPEIDGN